MFKKISLLILLLIYSFKAIALIEVDITRGNLDPLPLAVSPLSIDDKSKKEFQKILKKENIGSEISTIVENNLKTSGLFDPLSKDAFLQAPDIANLKPRFEDWNLIKAQALITGKVSLVDKKLRVEFRLWDVLAAKEMMALEDENGNRYYRNRQDERWVVYSRNIEASKITSDWFLWMHHTIDKIPSQNEKKYIWQKPHSENKSGSENAYKPIKIKKDSNIKKYETWK